MINLSQLPNANRITNEAQISKYKYFSENQDKIFSEKYSQLNTIPIGERAEVKYLEYDTSKMPHILTNPNELMSFTLSKNSVITRFNTKAIDAVQQMGSIEDKNFINDCVSADKELNEDCIRRSNSIRRNNAFGTSPSGLQQPITTLTFKSSEMIYQLLTQEDFSKIFHLNTQAGWHEEIFLPVVKSDFPTDISQFRIEGSNFQAAKNVTVDLSAERFPIFTYLWNVPSNMIIENQAALLNIDMLQTQIKMLSEAWHSTRSKALMIGSSDNAFPGFINNPSISTDTTLFAGSYYSNLTPAQKTNVLSNYVTEMFINSNSTLMPDIFLVSIYDATGFGAPYSPTFPTEYTTGRSLELSTPVLQETMNHISTQTGGGKIKVVGSAFVDSTINGVKTQYSLFNSHRDNIEILNPIPLTTTATVSFDGGLHINTAMYERLGGIIVKRPTSVKQFFIN